MESNVVIVSEKETDAMKKSLRESVCKVTFTKVNGEKRVMHCTLNETMIPPVTAEGKQTKKENPEVQPVYDVEAQGWRSFRWDSLIEFTKEINV